MNAVAAKEERLAVVLLLLAHALLAVSGIFLHSLTYDELSHLPAGMAMADQGEIVLNRQHPPLVKLLAGLAANTTHPQLPLEGAAYQERREWDFGSEVLFTSGNDHWALLRRGRLPTLLLSLLGGFFVYRFSRELFGADGGLYSLALWAFSPTILGHDGWVTMDAPLAGLTVTTLYSGWRLEKALAAGRPWPGWALAGGGGLGLALATKFSALVVAAALAAACLMPGGGISWRQRLRPALLLTSAALLVLWACYFFPRDPLFYWRDLGLVYRDLKADYLFYFAGELAPRFPLYFLATFALKSTPVELLVLPVALLAWCCSSERSPLLRFVIAPALLFFLATSALATNQGHRYLLPCYPLLFVLAGLLPAFLGRRWRHAGALLWLLAGGQAFEALVHQPDQLAYFNAFAGGPEQGPHWLDDSNIDWNQDFGRLPAWLAAHGIGRVRGAFLGRIDPAFYGLDWEPIQQADLQLQPRPGAYLLSAHVLARLLPKADQEGWHSDWLRRYQPVGVLGASLYLFVFPENTAGPAREPGP